jgi:hypothetical protein
MNRNQTKGEMKMKQIKSFFVLFFAAAAMVLTASAFTPASFAASTAKKSAKKPEDVFTFKDGAWRVKSGGKLKEFEGASGTGKRKAGPVPWCVVNPDAQEEAKGLKAGVLFYVKGGEPSYYFLLLNEDAVQVDDVSFNPHGWDTVAVVSRGGRMAELLSLYNLGDLDMEGVPNPAKSDKSFLARSDAVFWVKTKDTKDGPGHFGLAFTLADEKVKRPEEAGLFASTAAVYYPPQTVEWVNGGLVVLKKATKTENYEVSGVSKDGTEATLTVTSVKSEKDWKDLDKWQESEIKVKVPAPKEAVPK